MTTAPALDVAQDTCVRSLLLADALANTRLAVGKDDTLPLLTCVQLAPGRDCLNVVATDRYRAIWQSIPWPGASPGWEFLLTPSDRALLDAALTVQLRVAPRQIRDSVETALNVLSDSQMRVRVGNIEATLDNSSYNWGTYPDVRKIFDAHKPAPTDSLCFQARFLADLGRMRGVGAKFGVPVQISVGGPAKPIMATWESQGGLTVRYVLMPVRAAG